MNRLEIIVVHIQLAACIVALETDYAHSVWGNMLPKIPHLLI
jgi:hypothetical protein